MALSSVATAQRFKESRDEVRCAVGRAPLGSVYVRHRNRQQTVRSIRDFSSRGVSLCIDDALQPGEPVLIALDRGDTHLTFYAYVAWCHTSGDLGDAGPAMKGGCVAGLRVVGAGSLGSLVAR